MKKRFIVLTVCLALLTGVLPAAYADEATAPEATAVEQVTQTVTLSDLDAPATGTDEAAPADESPEATAEPTAEPTAAPIIEEATAEPTVQPTAAPTPTIKPAPIVTIISRVPVLEGTTAATNAEKVNIRIQPDTASDVLYRIEDEDTAVTPIDVVTLSDGSVWYSIEYTDADDNTYSGYIFSELLDVLEPAEATPAPTAAPVISGLEGEDSSAPDATQAPADAEPAATDEPAPEATQAPADQAPVPTQEAPVDTDDAQTPEEQAFLAAVDSVDIAISVVSCADENGVLMYGDTIKLSADIPEELSGATMQWQQTDESGEWFDLPDATESDLTLVLCSENMSASWRIHFVQQ